MGRTPKPAAEKALTGAGRRPVEGSRDAVPAPSASKSAPKSFAPPTWLTRKESKEVWKRIVPELARFNIMTEVFRDVIGRYCDHFASWIKVNREIQRQGVTTLVPMTNGGKMRRVNPAIRVRESLEKSLLDIEDRFGISPISRYRIVAHQAAHPGQRDLFRDHDTAPEGDDAAPATGAPIAERDTPIGMLN